MTRDGEHLPDLIEPLGLDWRQRRTKKLVLTADLVPLLKTHAAGREISGLNAYEG